MLGIKVLIPIAIVIVGILSLAAAPSTVWRDPPPVDGHAGSLLAAGIVGFAPDSALAAGLSVAEIGQVLEWLVQPSDVKNELLLAMPAAVEANAAVAGAEAMLRSSPSDASARTALQQAQSAARGATSRLAAARTALEQAIDGVLGRAVVLQMRSASTVVAHGLPAEFGAAALSEQRLTSVAIAFKAERRSARTGDQLAPGAHDTLQQIRDLPAVIAARQRQLEHSAAAHAAFDQAQLR